LAKSAEVGKLVDKILACGRGLWLNLFLLLGDGVLFIVVALLLLGVLAFSRLLRFFEILNV